MRRILGPVVLAALVLIALWFLQHDARPATAPAPDRDLAALPPLRCPAPLQPPGKRQESRPLPLSRLRPASPPAQGDVDEPSRHPTWRLAMLL